MSNRFSFEDISDSLAGSTYRQEEDNGNGIVLEFTHVFSGQKAFFKAFLEQLEDAFTSNWEETDVFGRMDSIQSFKNTKRVINLAWAVPSHSNEEAIDNFQELSKLKRFLYPAYEQIQTTVLSDPNQINGQSENDAINNLETAQNDLLNALQSEDEGVRNLFIESAIDNINSSILSSNKGNGNNNINQERISGEVGIISSPPILRLRFLNLISDQNGDGLYGRLSGLTFTPDLENGQMFRKDHLLVPTLFRCSAQFTVIHSEPLGWSKDKQPRGSKDFPYRVDGVLRK